MSSALEIEVQSNGTALVPLVARLPTKMLRKLSAGIFEAALQTGLSCWPVASSSIAVTSPVHWSVM